MKSCGVIVEYNPFHNGHAYHLRQARAQSQADVVIAVMSGNFLQRGEPALVDKWTRAEMALRHGADLVFELPVGFAIQAADYFAAGGVRILQALSCDALCFGTDAIASLDYAAIGTFFQTHTEVVDQAFRAAGEKGQSYAQQMAQVFQELVPEAPRLNTPNHILGLAYAKENAKYAQPMHLIPIQRQQTGYHDLQFKENFASATAIRHSLRHSEQATLAQTVMPPASWQLLKNAPQVNWENYWTYLRYQIIAHSATELRQIYQMTEGLENRFLQAAKTATSFAQFMEIVKTKRYTWTRLQRLATYVLLNIQSLDIEQATQTTELRLLGFTPQGQAFLKAKKADFSTELIARTSKQNAAQYPLTIKCDQLYQLGDDRLPAQNFGRAPLRSGF